MIPLLSCLRLGLGAVLTVFLMAGVPGSLPAAPAPASAVVLAHADPASPLIDKLVDQGLARAQLKPNPPASDAVILRRLYLDVIGRIPTAQEATDFLNDKAPNKRAKLIDKLLASEGYVSHWFNYWADILRIQSSPGDDADMRGSGDAYAAWVKDQLRANTSYHKLVYQMLTAEGYLWETGAVGYYMRDAGMPLDNMANTCQIFLGTRVACAQCHNHPFDDYKQKDFYEMAAYTCGIQTQVGPKQIYMEANGIKKLRTSDYKKMNTPGVEAALAVLLEPLAYGIRQDEKKQMLPDDFRGDPKNPSPREGKPGDLAKPQPVFSREKIKTGKEILENYAAWMTSPENPTFTVVVANRLWKACMGVGLIEPVDDIKKIDLDKNKNDATKLASNPALMAFLAQHMRMCGYDLKKFLRSIYNSQAYQREATTAEVLTPEEYRFPGPAVRRMSAEQLWDSFVTLVIPSPDQRKGNRAYTSQLAKMKAKAEDIEDKLRAGNGKALLNLATDLAKVNTHYDMEEEPWRKKLADARAKSDKSTVDAAQAEIDKLESARFDARKKVYDTHKAKDLKLAKEGPFTSKPPGMMDKDKMKKAEPIVSAADDIKWQGYSAEWMRAAELSSPAPSGHLLHEFGQSERITIQGANSDPSVTQALLMLNGPVFGKLTAKNTQLGSVLEATKTPEEKRDQLFLTILSRPPNDKEKALVTKQIQTDGAAAGLRKVAWALLNTREFTFLQ